MQTTSTISLILNQYIFESENNITFSQIKAKYNLEIDLLESRYASDNLYEISGESKNLKAFINKYII